MQSSKDRMTWAMKPLMTLCWSALLAACTPPSGDAQATASATASEPPPAAVTDSQTDCAEGVSRIQALICNNPDLAKQEYDLIKAEDAAHQTLDAAGKARLQAEQQRWIQHTRDLCNDTYCLQQVFAERLEVLSATRDGLIDQDGCEVPAGQQQCVEILVLRDPNSQLATFNTLLAENGQQGRLLGCAAATNIGAGHNDLIAASCTQEIPTGRRNVQLCSNQMVGQFAIEPAPAAYGTQATRQLLDFTLQHCAG
ncbi:hypothetical protein [Ectopseudomonas mendocina]|uniref:hypothetical protein n=1 Tax=Ectopseudomonas mendocina TaxID=300 RepID=UPI003EFD8823